jgi:hypothetical protein
MILNENPNQKLKNNGEESNIPKKDVIIFKDRIIAKGLQHNV